MKRKYTAANRPSSDKAPRRPGRTTTTMTFSMAPEVLDATKARAKELGMPTSTYVNIVLRVHAGEGALEGEDVEGWDMANSLFTGWVRQAVKRVTQVGSKTVAGEDLPFWLPKKTMAVEATINLEATHTVRELAGLAAMIAPAKLVLVVFSRETAIGKNEAAQLEKVGCFVCTLGELLGLLG